MTFLNILFMAKSENAWFRFGDQILQINGQSVAGLSSDKVSCSFYLFI